MKSLITLAFDIATLRHASNLPEILLERLRNQREYQGARYEIMVAAIFTRLGFTINWLDEEVINEPHCEFIARHNNSGTEIAVEAKSRHRSGVLHEPGILNESSNYKGDIQRLLNRAFKKRECGKMPYIVFIDINAPFKDSEDFKDIPWIKDILNKAKLQEPNTKEKPSPWNAIYFTNFSFHYQTDKEASTGQNLQSLPLFPIHQVPDVSIYGGILNALHYYGDIPDINLDD